jgi:hypothetical protein
MFVSGKLAIGSGIGLKLGRHLARPCAADGLTVVQRRARVAEAVGPGRNSGLRQLAEGFGRGLPSFDDGGWFRAEPRRVPAAMSMAPLDWVF